MLRQLQQSECEGVGALFRRLPHHLAISSVLDGTSPGSVYADAQTPPRAAFLMSTEGSYLAGDPTDSDFVHAFARQLDLWEQQGMDGLLVDTDPHAWREHAGRLFGGRKVTSVPRRRYSCRQLAFDWRECLPSGFVVRQVDETLLGAPDLVVPEHLREWVRTNWTTVEAFVERGFGCCTVHESQVVSWSIADCVSGNRVEIGIHTASPWRRRGLAKITAAAAVEHALTSGFGEAGWHCDDTNVGSWKTAESVGFERETDYTFLHCRLAS